MILSVSRRTDIPAFYSEWFFNRIKNGFVDVRNPMNYHQVSRVNIKPNVVDCIVFWTKDASHFMTKIDEISDYHYYFQYSINPYNREIERGVPQKIGIIDSFIKLSNLIGPHRVIWRYDPILLSPSIDINYHIRYFEELAKRLSGYTNRCVISFVDLYKKTVSNTRNLYIREPSINEILILGEAIQEIASKYGIIVQSCSESVDLNRFGIRHGACIDKEVVENCTGYRINVKKDNNQRSECGCVQSIDIGSYNTCKHLCKYCYANFNEDRVQKQSAMHNPLSSLLVGDLDISDIVIERKVASLREETLFME